MPATINLAVPIVARKVLTGSAGVVQQEAYPEEAAQTFLQGVPVQLDVALANGFIIECPAMTNVATAHIAGFNTQPGANLTTSGIAKTQNLIQKPPNQPLAVVTAIGAPPNDGLSYFSAASDDTLFQGRLGNGTDNTLAILAEAMIGLIMGLTKDAGNGWWYVDQNKLTVGTGACVEITGLIDPIGTLNGRVEFRVTRAAQQLYT